MAWYTPTMTASAGALLGFLDTYEGSSSTWSQYDTPASNQRVYECSDDPVLFYVFVNDSNASYAVIQLWEGWDSVNHVGTGRSRTEFTSTYTFRIYKSAGQFYISMKDHELRIVDGVTWKGSFIGRPGSLVDETQNVVLYCGSSTGSGVQNPMGYINWGSAGGWAFLFDHLGNQSQAIFGNSYYSTAYTFGQYFRTMGSDGEVYFPEMTVCPYYSLGYSAQVIGTLTGVGALEWGATAGCKFANGDTLTVGSDTWLVFGGTDGTNRYFTAFKED